MNKKRISMFLAFALSITLLAGCGEAKTASKPAGDLLRASLEKSFDMESAHGVTEINLNVELPDEAKANPSMALVAPFLKDAKLSIEQFSLVKEGKAYSSVKAEAGGQKVDAELFLVSPTKMFMKSDLLPKVVTLDVEKLQKSLSGQGQAINMMSLTGGISEKDKKAVKVVFDMFGEAFKGVEPTKRESEEVEFSTGKEKLDMISYSYKSNDEFIALSEKVMKNVIESEKMYELINSEEFKGMLDEKSKSEMPSKEEYDAKVKEAKEKFDDQFAKFKDVLNKAVEIKDITVKLGVDEKENLRYVHYGIELTVKNEGMNIPVKFDLTTKVDTIDAVKKEDVKTIEVDEKDTIDFIELISMGMMGGMPEMDTDSQEDKDMTDEKDKAEDQNVSEDKDKAKDQNVSEDKDKLENKNSSEDKKMTEDQKKLDDKEVVPYEESEDVEVIEEDSIQN